MSQIQALFVPCRLLHTNFYVILSLLPFFHPRSGREVNGVEYIINFFVSVGAQVVGYFLCKWLDPDNKRKGK